MNSNLTHRRTSIRLPKLALAAALSVVMAGSAFAGERSVEQKIDDARREAQIETAIVFNRHLNPFEIGVDVLGDTATLSGTVDEPIDRELAERVAMNAKGIKHVSNQIKVDPNAEPKPASHSERSFGDAVEDATITASIKSRLLWNEVTDGLDINVDTMEGRVTLTGDATTAEEKTLAGRLAYRTDGVHAVDNNIVVTPGDIQTQRTKSDRPVEDAWITTKVKSSLLMSKNVDGLDFTVETKNGVVYLGGLASSRAELSLAQEIAEDVRGVKRVDGSAVKVGA
ncbi:MAG: BON domain-containing protein [Xanthomonadales bacterium]|nr:BON domain-containing protein [Xanthomonadales bacterium]